MTTTRPGAILWIFCLQYFAAEAVAILAWTGSYSLSANYISDLGAVGCGAAASGLTLAPATPCSPLHALMNASFVLQGGLILGGALLVRPAFPHGRRFAGALALIGASGAGVALVGLAPEDLLPKLHYLGAAENLFCCNAGMAAMGLAMLRRSAARASGAIALAAGVAGLIGLGCLG
ncbi:MAG: DUF998 domain-containing protein, partial [Roseiarcus sp.]